ncbi:MAG: peptide ABC transporter permease [Nitrospinae bacterium CG22_combo_CG10-13_8_21_14_all_47_10]|nr:MAG: peptide ABC transporter permease [Nitrospinae bacterium CG22_combo_CG10-13_8_21_14_all_47_10]
MLKLNKELKVKLGVFKNDKRAYNSFLLLAFLFLVTLPAELICNVRPLLIVVEGKPYFPIPFTYSEKDFGGTLPSEPDYKSARFERILKGVPEITQEDAKNSFTLELDDFEEEEPAFSIGLNDFEDSEGNADIKLTNAEIAPAQPPKDYWILWPPVRYDYVYIPTESKTGNVVLAAPYRTRAHSGEGFIESSWKDGHYLGTDDRGRDVLARLIYGFRISMVFGASLAITGTLIGCLIGGTQGFFGGWIDLVGQRLTEIWGSIPRLYILIILSSFLVPSAILLFLILNLTAWMGIAAYIRAEFLKVRNFEFVKAAKALGVSNFTIMRRHILPNALTPVVTFFPFEVTAGILALVSLDYLNLGVPSPAPSMGELLAQGKNNLQALWILLPTFAALTLAITLLTFIGEGIRNAFDPRKTL